MEAGGLFLPRVFFAYLSCTLQGVRVVKYDVDEYESIASLYHVRMIPTLILFKKGKVIWQHSGVMRAQELYQAVIGAI